MSSPTHGSVADISMGRLGGVIIDDTAAHTGDFSCLQALTNCEITAMTLTSGWTGSMNGKTILAGTKLLVQFSSVTLNTGQALAYND